MQWQREIACRDHREVQTGLLAVPVHCAGVLRITVEGQAPSRNFGSHSDGVSRDFEKSITNGRREDRQPSGMGLGCGWPWIDIHSAASGIPTVVIEACRDVLDLGDASRIIHQWSDQQDTCSELTIFTTQMTLRDPSEQPLAKRAHAWAPLCGICATVLSPSSREDGKDGKRRI